MRVVIPPELPLDGAGSVVLRRSTATAPGAHDHALVREEPSDEATAHGRNETEEAGDIGDKARREQEYAAHQQHRALK